MATFSNIKSVVFDFKDNHGDSNFIGLRSIEFKNSSTLISLSQSDFTAYATTQYDESGWNRFDPKYAFDTSLSKTGDAPDLSWASESGDETNQRVIIVFDSVQTFDEIVINNYHSSGGSTSRGVKGTKIYVSTDTITDDVYGNTISNSQHVYDDDVDQHTASNAADDFSITPVVQPTIITAEPGIVTFSGSSSGAYLVPEITAEPGIVTFSGSSAGVELFVTAPPGIVTFSGSSSGVETVGLADAKLKYYFTLTGSPNIEIPISSFQARMRSGASTYLSVVIPGVDYAAAITTRSSGDMLIDAAFDVGDTEVRQTIISVHLDDIRTDEGTKSESITLVGYRQETYTQKAVTLTGYNYRSLSGGELLYRFPKPNLELCPGDLVTVGSDTFEADLVTYYVKTQGDPNNPKVVTQMEVSEAA